MPTSTKELSLIFVCLGNICRSPAAEGIMKAKLKDMKHGGISVTVDSAGIGAWHEGELPDHRMRRRGAARGYDLSSRARQIKAADFDRFDYVFAMDHQNVRDLKRVARNEADRKKILCTADFMTQHPDYDTVPDPYYGTERDFDIALDLIEDACDGIIQWLKDKA